MLAQAAVTSKASTLDLRITADEATVSYAFSADGAAWQTVAGGLDIRPLSVQAAGGGLHFTGAVVGLHARLESAAAA